MAVVPIITVPDPLLEKTCEKVDKVDNKIKEIVQNLLDTLRAAKNPEGAGLAAPQIGVLKRIIVVREFFDIRDPSADRAAISKEYVLLNPKIISSSKKTDIDYEACLSIPDTYGKVERPYKIKVKALNEKGESIRLTASGYFARVIQHEIDHLDGVLFTTKLIGKPITEKELDELYELDEAYAV